MKRGFQRAKAKIHHHVGRTWYGYLIPTDVLALHAAGAKFDKDVIDRVKDQKANGISTPRWVYFEPPEVWRKE